MGQKRAAFLMSSGAAFALLLLAASDPRPMRVFAAAGAVAWAGIALALFVGCVLSAIVYQRAQRETRSVLVAPFLLLLPYGMLCAPVVVALRRVPRTMQSTAFDQQHAEVVRSLGELLAFRAVGLALLAGMSLALGLGLIAARRHLLEGRNDLPGARSACFVLVLFAVAASIAARSACVTWGATDVGAAPALDARFVATLREVHLLDAVTLATIGAIGTFGFALAARGLRREREAAVLVLTMLCALAIPTSVELLLTRDASMRLAAHERWFGEPRFSPIVLAGDDTGDATSGCVASRETFRCGARVATGYVALDEVIPAVDAAAFRSRQRHLRALGPGEPGLHLALDRHLPTEAFEAIERTARARGYLSLVVYGIDAPRRARPDTLSPFMRPLQSAPRAETWLLESALPIARVEVGRLLLGIQISAFETVQGIARATASDARWVPMLVAGDEARLHALTRAPEFTEEEMENDRAAILGVIREHAPGFRYCYESALSAHPGLSGDLMLELEIDASGRVSRALGTGLDDAPEVGQCIARLASRMTFPASATGRGAHFPLRFDPPDPAPPNR